MGTRRQTRIRWWRRWNEKLKPLMTQTKIYALPGEPQPDTNDIYSIRYMRAGAQARCLDKCISGVYERVQTITRGQFAQKHYLSLCLTHTHTAFYESPDSRVCVESKTPLLPCVCRRHRLYVRVFSGFCFGRFFFFPVVPTLCFRLAFWFCVWHRFIGITRETHYHSVGFW